MSQTRPPLLLLGIASGLSPFGMAVIVPAMNSIAETYDASLASVQFVISAYLFGLATAQPVVGHLCDRFGRRRVMATGFAIFVAASVACAVTPSLELLIAARYLQAVGTSAGTVASRAILRDTCRGDELATAMSYIAAAMGIAPIIAPMIGGFLDARLSGASIHLATALIGTAVLFAVLLRLPETLSADAARPDARRLLGNYATLLQSRPFLGYTFLYGFIQGSFFCFLAVGAAYFLDAYGMESQAFGVVWGIMAVAYVIGAALGAKLTGRLGSAVLLRASVGLSVLAAAVLVALTGTDPVPILALLTPVFLLMMFSGTTTPGAMAGAIQPHPDMAGTASGLSSATGLVLSGSFTVIAGLLYTGAFRPVAMLMLAATVFAAGGLLLAITVQDRSRETG